MFIFNKAIIRSHLLLLLLVVLALLQATAQWRGMSFVHLGPKDGLACWTFDITQDSLGFIYYATDQGLVRYDGYEFRLFAHEPENPKSIGPGDIWAITTGSDGLLWMGSRVSGLNVFDPETLNFCSYALPATFVDHQSISSVAEDNYGHIWVGARHFRLLKFNKVTKLFTEFTPEWVNEQKKKLLGVIIEILPDRFDNNILWLAMPDYQEKAGESPNILVKYEIKENEFEAQLARGRPKYQDEQGNLWLANAGVSVYNPMTRQVKHFPLQINDHGRVVPISVHDINHFSGKNLVAAPDRLFELDEEGNYKALWHNQELGISEKLFIDRQNNLWIGRNKGVSFLNLKQQVIDYYAFNQFKLNERLYPGRLAYDQKNNVILISGNNSQNQGKDLFWIPVDKAAEVKKFSFPNTVYGIAADTSGGHWISYGDSLRYYPAGIRDAKNYQTVREDMPRLWNLSFNTGGFLSGIGSSTYTWYSIDNNKWHTINQQTFGSPFAFTEFQGSYQLSLTSTLIYSKNIFEIDLMKAKVTPLTIIQQKKYPGLEEINSVIIDQKKRYWISTLNQTACFERFGDSLRLIKGYTVSDGLKSAWVHELFADSSGRIWLFASNGLSAIDSKSQEIRHFGVNEGLVDHYIDPRQIITLSSGKVATVNGPGLIIFHPDSLWNYFSYHLTPIIIKAIRSSGIPLKFEKDPNYLEEIILSPQQKYLDIQYQALAFPSDYKVIYSYRLDELHQDWINNGENKIITLSNLNSGIYHLRIKAGAPESLSPEKKLVIKVLVPFSKQPWFIFTLFGGITAIFFGLYRLRIKHIHRQLAQKNEFNRQVAELELKALRAQMNPHFLFNSLNSIKNYILQANPILAADYLSNFAHLIRLILQYSGEKTITLEEELDALKLYIQLEQLRFDHGFDFDYQVADGIALNSIKIPPLLLQPYVENAIWHGLKHKDGQGHLKIEIYEIQENIICKIEDDGIGREESLKKRIQASKYRSFGLGINQDRIDIINKIGAAGISVSISDKYNEEGKPSGTIVLVALPIQD